jgi:hypothetical protein
MDVNRILSLFDIQLEHVLGAVVTSTANVLVSARAYVFLRPAGESVYPPAGEFEVGLASMRCCVLSATLGRWLCAA